MERNNKAWIKVKIYQVISKRTGRKVWAVDVTIDGVRHRRSDFATRQDAIDAIAGLRMTARSVRYGIASSKATITLGDLLEAREADPICNSSRNRKRLKGFFRSFVEFCGSRTPVRDVTLARMREFRDTMLRTSLKPSTIEFHMAGVVGALNSGPLYFPELETFKAPTLPSLVTVSRSTLVPRAELLAVVGALRAPHRYQHTREAAADVLEMLQLTGARVSEVCSLTRKDVHFDRHIFTLYGSKTHSHRTLPTTPSIEMILRRRAVFPSAQAMSQVVKLVAPDVGLEIGRDTWVMHDIRHTAASVLAEAGISHSIIATVLGHRLGGMTAIYTHATLQALKDAMSVLETYWMGETRKLRAVQ